MKAMLLKTDAAAVGALVREELDRSGGGDSLRPKLARFAKTHGIPL